MAQWVFHSRSQIGWIYRVRDRTALKESIRHPPCTCAICQTAFFTVEEQKTPGFSYRSRLSDVDATRLVESYIKKIHENRKHLADRLEYHADLLMSRWRKRSQGKRKALLTEVAPDLETSQWLNFRYGYSEECRDIFSRGLRRRQLLAPWLSIDVLTTNPAVLYALLHYRVAFPPHDWAAFDSRQLGSSWASGWFDVDFHKKCVIMHGPRYGSLVDWEEAAAHRADILGFPRARLVLEAQAFIMMTLRSIVDKVLDGVDDSLPARTEKWLELTTKGGFRRTGEVEIWSPYTNQAFSAPPVLDIEYLLTLAKTRLEASEDHLWHLQCDLAYMRRKIQSRKTVIKAANETEAAIFLANEIYAKVIGHFWWRWVEAECRHVADLHGLFQDSIQPGHSLPPQYDQALGALELLLNSIVRYQTQILDHTIPFCAGFCHLWTLICATSPSKDYMRMKTKLTKDGFEEDPLDWCLTQLLEPTEEQTRLEQTRFDHAMLFSFLQSHLSQCTAKEKARIDEGLYKNLSDLSTSHEMLAAIRLNRPRNKARSMNEVLSSEMDRHRPGWKRTRGGKTPPSHEGLKRCGKVLFEEIYAKPPGTQKNLDWVRRSRANRVALETFWDIMRGFMRKFFVGTSFTQEEIEDYLKVISVSKTPGYLDDIRSEEARILAEVEVKNIEPMLGRFTLAESKCFKFKGDGRQRKQKRKSRPQLRGAQPSTIHSAPDFASDTEPDLKTSDLMAVAERSLNIFDCMFPKTAEESSKTVNWDDFVHAICEVGFTAKNSGGSAVLFESINGGKIVFHRPHPVAKIDSTMLRSMGKRMAKWFGWSRERFTLAGSGTG